MAMTKKDKIRVIRNAVDACFVKGACHSCPFYQMPAYGKPGRCMGMRNAGKLIISYLADIENEEQDGKKK